MSDSIVRVAVTGGRDFQDAELVDKALSAVHSAHPFFMLVEGGCPRGADTIAREWAVAKKIPVETFHPNWNEHGRAAGPIRNKAMATSGLKGCVAFPGGRGTASMVRECEAAGVTVWFPRGDDESDK